MMNSSGRFNFHPLLYILIIISVSSCAGLPLNDTESPAVQDYPEQRDDTRNELSSIQLKLVEEANNILGAERLVVDGRQYPLDCTGTIMALYAMAGIDLGRDFNKYSGNAVARLYKYLDFEKLLYITKTPVPGDIVFWDNTWDANEDGKFNDLFTHAGMIVNRLEGDILEYIHYNYRRGIVLERMNLQNPDTRTVMIKGEEILINSPMRARSAPSAPGNSLASQLARGFGRGWELKN